jgi:two-component system sensor histidine kinase MprB
VTGPPERIARAVRNLLDNALKWGPPDEPIEVGVAEGEVVVRDRGPGMTPEHATRAFDRFWRAPDSRALPGSGLGLAIVSQVATDLGGSVGIELPPGGGTRVCLSLPWVAADPDVSPPEEVGYAEPSRSARYSQSRSNR